MTTARVDPREAALLPVERWPTAEEAAALAWFSKVALGPITARRRTWVPAMVPWRASDDGCVTEAVLAWYERFARGRPGVLVVEATGIRDVPSGPLLRIGDDRFVPGLTRLVETVRRASGGETRLFVQLIDFLSIRRRPTPEVYFGRHLVVEEALRARFEAAVGPADDAGLRAALLHGPAELHEAVLTSRQLRDLRFGHREEVSDTHLPHVAALPAVLPGLFAAAARRAAAAGFDGVELHYAHAYTMASFLSRTNVRADGWGGSAEGRVRLPLAVLRAVREAVGPSIAIGARILGDEAIEGGSTLPDACDASAQLCAAGLDVLSISRGGRFEDARQPKIGEAAYPYTGPSGEACMPSVRRGAPSPWGRNVPLAAGIRAALRAVGLQTPVVTAGGIASPWQAEEILRSGQADLVASARQTLADPDWFEKIRLGRGAEVRRCLFTNYCEALDQRHEEVTCQRWDRLPDEPDSSAAENARSRDGRRRLIAPAWLRKDERGGA